VKRENLNNFLTAWILSVALAMGGVGCITSAFLLEPESLLSVFLTCLIVTGLSCLCFCLRGGIVIFLCAVAFFGGWLYREGSLVLETESFLFQISRVYHQGYGWGYIRWSNEYLGDVPIDGALRLASCLCAIPSAFALCRKKGLTIPVLIGLVPLFACMVVIDTIPGSAWLILLIVSLLMMILPNTVRLLNPRDGRRLTAILLLPVLLFSMLLFALVPQGSYESRLENLQQAVMSFITSLPFVQENPDGKLSISFAGDSQDHVNLESVGPRFTANYAVMDVIATSTGHLYLRGQSFDTYDGTSWIASDNADLPVHWPTDGQLSGSGISVTVSTRSRRSFYYIPYYLREAPEILQGKVTNPGKEQEYSFLRYSLSSQALPNFRPIPTECLKLPEKTQIAANAYIKGNLYTGQYADTTFDSVEALAAAIGQLVERSAKYNLNTLRMPEGEEDFAMWFLEQSETGYCVHFASAATVLLRSQGIPARFVNGYTCQTQSGRRVTVTADQAHAWVEYYDSELGCWRVLDPTPAGSGSGSPPETSVTVPTVPTAPTEPTAPTVTEPTQPTPTQPTEPQTDPTENTEPTTAPTQPSEAPTEPSGGIGTGPGEGPGGGSLDWEKVKFFLLPLLWCLCAGLVIAGQYFLRRRFRQKRMRTGHHNRRAIARWREARRLGRLIGAEPPERLLQLAEKARFSQHTMTVQELMEFDAWISGAYEALRKKPWYQRIVLRLIWAV